MFGELTLFLASAAIVDRARPDVENMDGPMPTSSFPSGHVAATILIWATAAVLVLPRTRAWWRWVLLALAVAMPLWVAVSRMYRGMHHPTDIVGSMLLSALWLSAVYWLVKPNRDLAEQPCEEDLPEPVSDLGRRRGRHAMLEQDWFLTEEERGNPHTRIAAWTDGNAVRPLIDGKAYFAELYAAIERMEPGDLLLFTDWRGDPASGSAGRPEIGDVLCAAAERGVSVKGLIWRSHWNALQFSAEENRRFGEEIEAAGGECLRDMRVRVGGSHHQKLVVLRHPGRPELDRAYVGGIDLCHGRRDTPRTRATRSRWRSPRSTARGRPGTTSSWRCAGRWSARSRPRSGSAGTTRRRCPATRCTGCTAGRATRTWTPTGCRRSCPTRRRRAMSVQLLRTYPHRRTAAIRSPPTANSASRAATARRSSGPGALIYLEDQYLWSPKVASCFADALRENPGCAWSPSSRATPTGRAGSAGRRSCRPARALDELREAGGDRVAVYSPENPRHPGVRARQGLRRGRRPGPPPAPTTSACAPGPTTRSSPARSSTRPAHTPGDLPYAARPGAPGRVAGRCRRPGRGLRDLRRIGRRAAGVARQRPPGRRPPGPATPLRTRTAAELDATLGRHPHRTVFDPDGLATVDVQNHPSKPISRIRAGPTPQLRGREGGEIVASPTRRGQLPGRSGLPDAWMPLSGKSWPSCAVHRRAALS